MNLAQVALAAHASEHAVQPAEPSATGVLAEALDCVGHDERGA